MASFHRTKRTLENDMCPSYQAPTWVSTSLLTGFPGLEWAHRWNSLPICIGYLLALLGNATILHRVRTDPALHQPVYYFLAVLAGTSGPVVVHAALRAGCAVVVDPDGGPGALCSAAALPTLLHGIRRALLYSSGQLVAVHFSLRWASRLTGPRVALVGVVLGLRSAAITAAPSLHLLKFDYCHRRALTMLTMLTAFTRTWST